MAVAQPTVRLQIEEVHPWRPPFGLERVGHSHVAVIEASEALPAGELTLTARLAGSEVARQAVTLSDASPRLARVAFEGLTNFDEMALTLNVPGNATPVELGRQKTSLPLFEADAIARPEQIINPVDLGTILVPGDWLLLGPGQSGRLAVRAIQRTDDDKTITIKAWFESSADPPLLFELPLQRGACNETTLTLPQAASQRDVLHVSAVDAVGAQLWQKEISTIRVAAPLNLPHFGAVETKLRYDAPISVRDPATGTLSSLPYADGWNPQLKDVVVALPNGSRMVFWRGSSYIPFWASRHNVGLCCEWAEIIPPFPLGRTDCVEPLMDKELRYGRVEIVESTAARIHVRWAYQSNDLLYKVWGDQAVEDYYFYPDGYGTRVLTLKRDPSRNYELSEFILIAPQETYPLSFVPSQPIDILFADGEKRRISFPAAAASLGTPRDMPAVYRVRMHKDDPTSVVYFTPDELTLPKVYTPFYDRGQLVTPAYWGSHWPLARGNATGEAVDERIHDSPHHTSLATWQEAKPEPISVRTGPSVDSLGRSKVMTTERWVWMIGMTDAPDGAVLAQAQSFVAPPSVEVVGAHIHPEGYAAERRAVRLVADGEPEVALKLKADRPCVNPVIELDAAPGKLASVSLNGRQLESTKYAWDGNVLWLDGAFTPSDAISLQFENQ
ncbi:MAG: hypothetical protein H0T51_07135 [Pirellulales bacterium]|nr:hypothetical protein [Pirellulales bacterium]